MFKKILFATTASPACAAAAKFAFKLAEKYDSELIICHVFGVPSHGNNFTMTDILKREGFKVEPSYSEWAINELKILYKSFIKKHKKPKFKVFPGIPSTEILRLARKKDVDCIIMGSHAREKETGSSRFRGLVGKTMHRVAQRARCPILIINRPCETCFWYFNKIIFGTDFSKASMVAFQFAYKLAEVIGCKLYLFHAINIDISPIGLTKDQNSIEQLIIAAKAKIKNHYVSQMGNFDNYEITVWEGIPYIELLKFTREVSGDLVVLAHHTQDELEEKAMFGSTVEQVVLRSACPVASVNRPNNF